MMEVESGEDAVGSAVQADNRRLRLWTLLMFKCKNKNQAIIKTD